MFNYFFITYNYLLKFLEKLLGGGYPPLVPVTICNYTSTCTLSSNLERRQRCKKWVKYNERNEALNFSAPPISSVHHVPSQILYSLSFFLSVKVNPDALPPLRFYIYTLSSAFFHSTISLSIYSIL